MSSLTTAGSGSSMETMEPEEEFFDTRLSLDIGVGDTSRPQPPPPRQITHQQQTTSTTVRLFGELISPPYLPHHRETRDHQGGREMKNKKKIMKKARTPSQSQAAAGEDDDVNRQRRSSPSDGGSASRKKLRLTGAQATMLEDSFRAHNILSHAQKHDLARRVGLSARQVEVWFQNRRARTKLKQTELDCELLRRWCDRLTDENARLRRDLADLRAGSTIRLPTAAGAVCPSCCDNSKMKIAGDVA